MTLYLVRTMDIFFYCMLLPDIGQLRSLIFSLTRSVSSLRCMCLKRWPIPDGSLIVMHGNTGRGADWIAFDHFGSITGHTNKVFLVYLALAWNCLTKLRISRYIGARIRGDHSLTGNTLWDRQEGISVYVRSIPECMKQGAEDRCLLSLCLQFNKGRWGDFDGVISVYLLYDHSH